MPNAISRGTAAQLLPPRPVDAHKGTFGHTFVIAGSRGFTGAMRLTCEAAGRGGCGLVTAGVPHALGDVAAVTLLESMSRLLPDTPEHTLAVAALDPALAFAADKQAVVLGPGISTHPETRDFVRSFVPRCAPPLVIDADGLNNLADVPELLRERPPASTILTPHPGEMARLIKTDTPSVQEDRKTVAAEFAATHGVVVVLKGYQTIVASPDGAVAINTTGNSGMGTGGTGDVLAGLLGGLLAQGLSPWDAARLGVWLHGYAGDCAAEQFTSRAMLARDVLACIPQAFGALVAGA
jgi:hydroxyethylthiazole kinase-like uncharacterized protein yjeF